MTYRVIISTVLMFLSLFLLAFAMNHHADVRCESRGGIYCD